MSLLWDGVDIMDASSNLYPLSCFFVCNWLLSLGKKNSDECMTYVVSSEENYSNYLGAWLVIPAISL